MSVTHWHEVPIYVMDFEGTAESGIIEYGLVKMFGRQIVEATGDLCYPTGKISSIETRQHGLTLRKLSGKRLFADHVPTFLAARREGLFAAHNAHVEKLLLGKVEAFPGAVPVFYNDAEVCSWGPWIDTLCLYRNCYPKLKSYGLADLLDRFSLVETLDKLAAQYCPPDRAKYHCALYDALGAALLLQRLGNLSGFEDMNLWWLLRQATDDKERSQKFQQRELDL